MVAMAMGMMAKIAAQLALGSVNAGTARMPPALPQGAVQRFFGDGAEHVHVRSAKGVDQRRGNAAHSRAQQQRKLGQEAF